MPEWGALSTTKQMPSTQSLADSSNESLDGGPLSGPGTPIVSAHGFRIEGVGFLLAENDYAEVFNDLALCALPNTPDWFIGMANMRGTPVPIIDLAHFLSIVNKPATVIPKILVIGQREKSLGIVIDSYPVHLTFPKNEEFSDLPSLPGSINKYAESYYKKESMKWITWNKSKLIRDISNQISARQHLATGQ